MVEITRSAVEDFLYHEAALLDGWQLQQWAELFTDDGQYLVPSTDRPDGAPDETLYLIYDDRHRLGERARRLLQKTAHAEFPHSRTRHLVSNVRLLKQEGEIVKAACAFVVYRSKREVMDIYPGRSNYELVASGTGALRIRLKRAVLDLDALRPQGKLSIIL